MSQQPERQQFSDIQYQFSQAVRDPEHACLPVEIEPRRMKIYQQLFYNNIEGFIANGFPVLRAITADEDWHAMIRDFMVKHRCKTPLFHEISREFLSYLDAERDVSTDPVFINELAHYEWVELALSVSTDTLPERQETIIDDLDRTYQLSPLAWPLTYHYPVHLISPEFQPEKESDTPVLLLVYRNEYDNVTFLELNPVSFRLIELVRDGKMTGYAAAKQISMELQHPNPDIVLGGAHSLISDWLERDILL